MINILMCSTILGKRRFSVECFKDPSDLSKNLLPLSKNHPDLVIFPVINQQNFEDVRDLLDKKCRLALKEDLKKQHLTARVSKLIFYDIVRIEHVHENIFRFVTRNRGSVSSDSYNLSLR